jgi:hypothetical protein
MTVDEVLRAAADGSLPDLLERRATEVTPDLAEQVREVFSDAVRQREGDLAEVAAMAGAHLWVRIGDRHQAIKNYIDSLQMGYMRANEPDEYLRIRGLLRGAADQAAEVGAPSEAFKAATIAADCSFWAAEASDYPASDELTLQALDDVLATAAIHDPTSSAEQERFTSLLTAVAQRAMETFWRADDEARASDLLRRLSMAADNTIPEDFKSQEGTTKTVHVAQILAALSERYG